MKKLQFYADEIIDKSIISAIAHQVYAEYEERFERIPLAIRAEFIKYLVRLYEKERKELNSLLLRYNRRIKSITRAEPISMLTHIHQKLNEITGEIFTRSRSVIEVNQRCTKYRDLLTLKVISFTRQQLEKNKSRPQNAFAWIRMGSTGREEQTLYTDQDNLLVYKNPADKAYYEDFAHQMVENLAKVGFAKCRGNIMPTNKKWFGTIDEWREKLHSEITETPNLVDLIVLTEAKYAGGNYPLAHTFIQETHNALKSYQASFQAIAKATVMMPIALSMFRKFKTEKKGEYKDMLNVKFQGWLRLIMLVLLFCLEHDILDETNTIKRIKALEKTNVFDPDLAQDIMESYITLSEHKILSQIKYLKGEVDTISYFVNPYKLDKKEQTKLRKALSTVEQIQRLATSSYNITDDTL